MIEWYLPQVYKDCSISANQYDKLHWIEELKTYMITIVAEKASDKIQHPFMIFKKTSPESGPRQNLVVV